MTIKEMTHAFLLALADYEQADMHGTFVKVPRQAVDETLEHVTRLTDEVEQLRDLLNRANLTRDEEAVVLKLGTLETANAMLTAENERLRAALEWYGDPENYKRRDDPYEEGRAYPPKIVLDNGDKARAALQEPRND